MKPISAARMANDSRMDSSSLDKRFVDSAKVTTASDVDARITLLEMRSVKNQTPRLRVAARKSPCEAKRTWHGVRAILRTRSDHGTSGRLRAQNRADSVPDCSAPRRRFCTPYALAGAGESR